MIYIFSGIKEICLLPKRCCTLCGECCKAINCKPIKDCCDTLARGCSGFVEKPLSSFVVITIILSVVEIAFLAMALTAEGISDCALPSDASVGLTVWCMIQLAFAVINVAFAPYFQYKVWRKLFEETDAENLLQSQPEIQVEKSMVQDSFKYVFMNDFGVCFYFFGLIAAFYWSSVGYKWIAGMSGCAVDKSGLLIAANIGWWFFLFAVLYTVAWYCCACCAKSTVIKGADFAPVPPQDVEEPLQK